MGETPEDLLFSGAGRRSLEKQQKTPSVCALRIRCGWDGAVWPLPLPLSLSGQQPSKCEPQHHVLLASPIRPPSSLGPLTSIYRTLAKPPLHHKLSMAILSTSSRNPTSFHVCLTAFMGSHYTRPLTFPGEVSLLWGM